MAIISRVLAESEQKTYQQKEDMMIHTMTEGEWVTLSEQELEELERPDYSKLSDYETQPLWSEVLPGLWQGGTGDEEDMNYYLSSSAKGLVTNKHFDTVVTMYAYALPADWFVKELRFAVYDSNMKDFDAEELFELVKIAHTDWRAGKRVLIRCQAGWNRSGLVMALVMMREGYGAREAIDLIREQRSSHALCNKTFESFLLKEDPKVWRGQQYGVAKKN